MKSEFEEIMDRMGFATIADFGSDGEMILKAAFPQKTVEDVLQSYFIEREQARRAIEEAQTKQMYIAKYMDNRVCNTDNIASGAKIKLDLMDVHRDVNPQCNGHVIIDHMPKDVLLAMQKAMPDHLVLLDTANSYIQVYFIDSPETE